jgi:glycosyltransferase involved in cell wall biosynthesis
MHTRKKILVFSDWFLPGYKAGGPIRSLANLVQALDFDFWIVTRITDHHSTEPYVGIMPGVWTPMSSHVHVCYMHESDMNGSFVEKLFDEKTFDYIYFNSLFSPLFTLMPLRIARKMGMASRCVLAPRGMLKEGALSIKSRKKKLFLFAARALGWFNHIRWHATNEQEAAEIRLHLGRRCDIYIAPNLATTIQHSGTITHKEPGALRLISVARISSEKGIREALLFLKSARLGKGLACIFYGTQQDPAYLEECVALAAQIEGATISFPGELRPELMADAFRDIHFFYLATWGENFGHAIAEALQHGKPVIISNRTPWRDLTRYHAGWDLNLHESSFSEILGYCFAMNQEEYAQWSQGAAAYGSRQANDPRHVQAYYSVFE